MCIRRKKPDCKKCQHFGIWEFNSRECAAVCTIDTNGACREAPAPNPGGRRCYFSPKDPFSGVSNMELAYRVLGGEFGDGSERMRRLGGRYNEVQSVVNGMCEANKPWYMKNY